MAQVRNPLPSIEKEFVQLARDMVHGSFANHGLAF